MPYVPRFNFTTCKPALATVVLCCFLILSATSSSLSAAEVVVEAPPVSREVLAMGIEPVPPIINPGPEYSATQLDYAMVIGMDRTPKGRLWAAWVAGGDSDKGFFVAASSDDDGNTWSPTRLVINPTDAPTGLPRRALVGNFWTDPTGKLWLFYDQSMGYYDGRAGAWAITCENPDAANPALPCPSSHLARSHFEQTHHPQER